MSEKRLKTFMTQVFFKPDNASWPIPMKREDSEKNKTNVFLLDDLLGGGIFKKRDPKRNVLQVG